MPDRQADYPIDPMFTERWSPRAYTGEAIGEDDLFAMLEAARWAPSASNVQPWRFIYAMRDTPQWLPIFDGLMQTNQRWTVNAAALVVFAAQIRRARGDEVVVSTTHGFDTGAAWLGFALQAHRMGYATHAMAGFFNDKLRGSLHVPDDIHLHAVVAVGRQASPDTLPDDLRGREVPSDRHKLADSLVHGTF